MGISIEWQKPVQLTKSKEIIIDKDDLPEHIPSEPGVYYFSRRFGETCKPFYIGETTNIRARLRSHLNTVSIVDVLRSLSADNEQIKQGTRYFHFGVFRRKAKQDIKKCIRIVEKIMIDEAVANGIPILNKRLTTIRTSSVNFIGNQEGRGWFDKEYEFEA